MARNFACTDLVVNVLPNRTVISSAISEAVMPDWKSSISNSVHSNFHDAMPYHAYGSPVMLGKGGGKTVRVGSAWSLMGAWDVGT